MFTTRTISLHHSGNETLLRFEIFKNETLKRSQGYSRFKKECRGRVGWGGRGSRQSRSRFTGNITLRLPAG